MIKNNTVEGLRIENHKKEECLPCKLGKCQSKSHPSRSTPKQNKAGTSLHIDTAGPVAIPSMGGARYFLVCKDEYSSYLIIAFIKNKDEIKNEVKQMISKAELETKNHVLQISTDQGSEFINKSLEEFCKERGIIHKKSSVYTPQQNGLVEREIRTIVRLTRSTLIEANANKNLWA